MIIYCLFKHIAFDKILFSTTFGDCQHCLAETLPTSDIPYLAVTISSITKSQRRTTLKSKFVGRCRTNHGYTRSSVKAAKVCAKKNASQLLTDWHYPLGVAFLIVNR